MVSLYPLPYSGPYHHEEIEAASQRTARSLCAYCPLNGGEADRRLFVFGV